MLSEDEPRGRHVKTTKKNEELGGGGAVKMRSYPITEDAEWS